MDVTEHKLAEQAIRSGEAALQEALNRSAFPKLFSQGCVRLRTLRAITDAAKSTLSGSIYVAASPPTSIIGSRSEVTTGHPHACDSMIGHPKPSCRDGNNIRSALE